MPAGSETLCLLSMHHLHVRLLLEDPGGPLACHFTSHWSPSVGVLEVWGPPDWEKVSPALRAEVENGAFYAFLLILWNRKKNPKN